MVDGGGGVEHRQVSPDKAGGRNSTPRFTVKYGVQRAGGLHQVFAPEARGATASRVGGGAAFDIADGEKKAPQLLLGRRNEGREKIAHSLADAAHCSGRGEWIGSAAVVAGSTYIIRNSS